MQRLANNTVRLETRHCHMCNEGQVAGKKRCAQCNGTGNGKKGGKGTCRGCLGFKTQPDFENTVPCPYCRGTTIVPETAYDTVPQHLWESLTFRVYRENRRGTWNEAYLAFGDVYSVTDYGAAWNANDDDALIAKVRDRRSGCQLVKITNAEGILCDHIAIRVHRDGYVVEASN